MTTPFAVSILAHHRQQKACLLCAKCTAKGANQRGKRGYEYASALKQDANSKIKAKLG